jgi:quinol-cytochrome oxidoreductase complex cytochrome b subunit
MRPSFFHHLHPPTIPSRQSRLRYTLGAGGLSVYFLLVLILTGILEMFYYIPTPEQAAQSIQTITFLVPFGNIIRNMHFWAAQLLVVSTLLHLLRVIFTGAYAPPRRFNYLLGLILLILTLFLDFSGYILRWDEGIRWALVTGTNLIKTIPVIGSPLYILVMGGTVPGPATLIRFYAWHIFGLTLLIVGLGVWHVFLVRRDGGIAVPPPEERQDKQRITRFELVWREALAVILATIVLIIMAVFLPAPIASAINEVNPQAADSSAPWFFQWIQQLLRYGNPFWMGIVVPMLVVIFLISIPYLFPLAKPHELGEWFPRSARAAQISTATLTFVIIVLTILSYYTSQ